MSKQNVNFSTAAQKSASEHTAFSTKGLMNWYLFRFVLFIDSPQEKYLPVVTGIFEFTGEKADPANLVGEENRSAAMLCLWTIIGP